MRPGQGAGLWSGEGGTIPVPTGQPVACSQAGLAGSLSARLSNLFLVPYLGSGEGGT